MRTTAGEDTKLKARLTGDKKVMLLGLNIAIAGVYHVALLLPFYSHIIRHRIEHGKSKQKNVGIITVCLLVSLCLLFPFPFLLSLTDFCQSYNVPKRLGYALQRNRNSVKGIKIRHRVR